jgi:pantetheine-phosphate adenylyltransferase
LNIYIYPGSFDPVTNGHFDIIQRSLEVFDLVIVGVAHNLKKSPSFSVEERVEMLQEVTRDLERLRVTHFGGLVIDFARKEGADVILRGLRAVSDFEYELQMALTNRKLADDIETVFMMPNAQYSFLSSSIVKEIARLRGNVACFVPPFVEKQLRKKFQTD